MISGCIDAQIGQFYLQDKEWLESGGFAFHGIKPENDIGDVDGIGDVLRQKSRIWDILNSLYYDVFMRGGVGLPGVGLKDYIGYLSEVIDSEKRKGGGIILLTSVNSEGVPEIRYAETTIDLAKRKGVEYTDPNSLVGSGMIKDNTHPNYEGHSLIAGELYMKIKEMYPDWF